MTMFVDVWDVEHGACFVVTAPNGNRLMVDTGHNNTTGWRPSKQYWGQKVDQVTISNYDEDHCSDLPGMFDHVQMGQICLNTSVDANTIDRLKKEGGVGPGIQRLQRWMRSVSGKPGGGALQWGGMSSTVYYNNYPAFDDENNLSVVTFVEWAGFKIVFPGDMETAGWKKLLERQAFRDELRGVTVFVASHHGRRNGCCADVFQNPSSGSTLCYPWCVVMSDDEIQYESQETTPWYRARARGCNTSEGERHVLTTRCDKNIRFRVEQNGEWYVTLNA